MKKKWNQYYLLLGNLIALILCLVCSFLFVNSNLKKAAEKRAFESIYLNTAIDFIIPGPSVAQVADLEDDEANGIATVTPYYETTVPVRINGATATGTAVILPVPEKIEFTPYCSQRITGGNSAVKGGNAVADETYIEKNGCRVGDTVSISIAEREFTFTLSGIAESNTYYSGGTIALILTEEDAKSFEDSGIRYSAAYVSASDLSACEHYLFTEYKPFSRLKEASEFENEETYNQHLRNFNDADWSKEITNCHANYEMLRIRYDNVQSGIWVNIIIMTILVAVGISVFNLVLLTSNTVKGFFRTILTKKSGSKKDIISFYRNGIVLNCIVFCVGLIALYFVLCSLNKTSFIGYQLFNCAVPVIGVVLVSVVLIIVSAGYVEKHYKIKAIKNQDAPEDIRVEVI